MRINRERARTNIERRRIPIYLPTTYLKVYHNVLVFEFDEVLTIKVFGPFL